MQTLSAAIEFGRPVVLPVEWLCLSPLSLRLCLPSTEMSESASEVELVYATLCFAVMLSLLHLLHLLAFFVPVQKFLAICVNSILLTSFGL